MSELLCQCQKLFGTKDVYHLFKVENGCSTDQLKKGYYKISLQVHPDKVSEDDRSTATEKFQLLSKLFKILSDSKKRQIYEKTGELADDADDFGLSDDKDWQDYWRELFPTVTVDDIDKFHREYKGSDEELADLKRAYTSAKGDMQKIIDSVMCATVEDEDRFRDILMPLINDKQLPSYKKFTDETKSSKKKRQSKASKEAKEAEKAAKQLKGGSLDGYNDLALALQRNREKRGGIISYLEQKYATAEHDELSEEEVKGSRAAKKRTKGKGTSKSKRSKTA